MSIPQKDIDAFATTIAQNNNSLNAKTAMGTVTRVDGSSVYVLMDGSNYEAPCSALVSAAEDDRVVVTIENHKGAITANATNIAAGINEFNTVGTKISRITIDGNGIHLLDDSGSDIALFTSEGVYFYSNGEETPVAFFGAEGVEIPVGKNILLGNLGLIPRADGHVSFQWF